MALNSQKGNMYGFITHTWNAVKGKCMHECVYCYMKNFNVRAEPYFDEKELTVNLGGGKKIFVGSSCDMFAENIPIEWIASVLNRCNYFINSEFLFQTKNPKRYHEQTVKEMIPKNSTRCITIETNRAGYNFNAPPVKERFEYAKGLENLMITIEPIMDFDFKEFVEALKEIKPYQVNIGANTDWNNRVPEPPKEKVRMLIDALKSFTEVHLKDNLKRLL